MTMKTTRIHKGLVWTMVAALALPLTACDKILEVTDPDTVNPGTLTDPDFIDVVVTGAIGDFAEAYDGDGGDAFLSVTSAMSDEFFSTGTFTTRTATDRRNQFTPQNNNTSDNAYTELQRARRATMNAAELVADNPDKGTSDPDYALMKALQAYTYVALGEGFCSSIPISNDETPDPADGPPRTGTALFQEALPIFDAAGGTDLASVGRARALMNLGDYAAAAAAVAGVPTSFNQFIEHSDNADQNPFFALQSNGRWSVSHLEGGNATGVPFRGADPNDPAGQDPRLPWFEDPAGGFDSNFRLFVSLKYPSFTSPVPFASGIEARLIEAEAALATGDVAGWLGMLNALRADVGNLMAAQIDDYSSWVASPSLAPLTDPGTAGSRVDLHFQERAFWLWGTGHRLGDLRRLINQYGRTEAQAYPSGAYHKGGEHGSDVAFPLDFDEINNTLYDPGTCVVTNASYN
jgi:hypothetical protein